MPKKRRARDAAGGFAAAVEPNQQRAAESPTSTTASGGAATAAPAEGRRPVTGRQVRPHSKQALVYLHPDGHRAIKLYAAEADRPMQDVMTELLERGARQVGLNAPMRPAPPDENPGDSES